MNGFNLAFVSQKTGIKEGKLKMIVNRHPVLQEMPYSVKNGGNRIFFDDFVVWLKNYEGLTGAESQKSQPVTSVTSKKLPSGAQLHEIRILAEKGVLTKDQVADAMGIPRQSAYQKPVQRSLELEGPRLTPEELERDLMSLVPGKVS